jgi:hypothetical protein
MAFTLEKVNVCLSHFGGSPGSIIKGGRHSTSCSEFLLKQMQMGSGASDIDSYRRRAQRKHIQSSQPARSG